MGKECLPRTDRSWTPELAVSWHAADGEASSCRSDSHPGIAQALLCCEYDVPRGEGGAAVQNGLENRNDHCLRSPERVRCSRRLEKDVLAHGLLVESGPAPAKSEAVQMGQLGPGAGTVVNMETPGAACA